MQFPQDHTPSPINNQHVSLMMRHVLYALLPATLLMLWFFGWGIISNILIASLAAVVFEAASLRLRQRPIQPFLTDFSALVTAWLLALSLPPFVAWWVLVVALFFAIVVAKQLYGGLGYNPFNPAMIGYAVVLIAFPSEMVSWTNPIAFSMNDIGLGETLQRVSQGASWAQWDSLTGATVLDSVHSSDAGTINNSHITKGLIAGYGWEWISLAYLVGGLWLLYKRIISWHIPVALLASLSLIASIAWLADSQQYASPLFHLLAGGTMLGAFFIATDPISASTTPYGRLIYAACIGLFIYIIRVWGSTYPDGVAFAVIIMNMAVPMIDAYTQPAVFGQQKGR